MIQDPSDLPNPVTQAAFRRQAWLEIYLPLGFALLIVGVVVVLLARSGVGDASSWADAALVVLILPLLILGLLVLVGLAFLAYGLFQLGGLIPGPARQVQEVFYRAQFDSRRATDLLVSPVIAVRGAVAALRAARRQVSSIFVNEDGHDGNG